VVKNVSDYLELSNIQMDALKEIGNIGAGNAATALAQMINSKIDMVVASSLMSMGMMMLPPMMISLPFKILLFVLVDGWNLVIQSLIQSFG
jgi:chemotaxis protein CheY-P-specific phosphatase CheC